MTHKKILLSFVGSNDAGKLIGKNDGAILTALSNEKFNEVILLWNESKSDKISYSQIVAHLNKEISKKKIKVSNVKMEISDVTDHNVIYRMLKDFTDSLVKNDENNYTAAISSGTPAMQVCWILLAESADFSEEYPLRLIKVKDPKFGKSANVDVKLESSLPKIQRMKEEIEGLKNSFLPMALIDVSRGILSIDGIPVDLTPIEFSYYRYFASVALDERGKTKFSFISLPIFIMEKIYTYHQESFPNLDLLREELRQMIKNNNEIPMTTFRGVISKINKKISHLDLNSAILENFIISTEGKRGAKFYFIKAPSNKLKITI